MRSKSTTVRGTRQTLLTGLILAMGLAGIAHADADDATPGPADDSLSEVVLQSRPVTVQSARRTGFVTRKGTRFDLDGHPFYFQGTNFYRLSLIDRQTDSQVYEIMQQLANRGLKTVRFWGFACGSDGARAMLESVTKQGAQYDESALQRLDLALDAARRANLKVILPLVNYQKEYCSMNWWVRQVTGKDDTQLFYTDPDVRTAFKRHITTLLNRVNTVYRATTGEAMRYADDPTIMAIELANEPQTEEFYEAKHGLPPGDLLYHWLSEMSDFVHAADPNHMIATGEEGYKTAPTTTLESSLHPWLANGSKGADFARNLSLPNISFATVHPYPDNWGIPPSDMAWFGKNFLQDRAAIAHGQNKPIILEETGFSSRNHTELGYIVDPAHWIAQMYAAANEVDYTGTMIWEVVPVGSEIGDYIFDFDSPVAAEVFRQADWMNRRH